MARHPRTAGFTLIELSIVLVVIGLIAGGVLVGRELISAARVRGVISEQDQLLAAIHTFKLKYNCTPGDCRHASQFFGAAADCSGATSLTDAGTCDGNGNGQICTEGDGVSCDHTHGEHTFAAHHLHQSGLVHLPLEEPNNVTVTYSGFSIWRPGFNTLGSRAMPGLGWQVRSIQVPLRIGTTFNGGATHFCGNIPGGATANRLYLGGAAINSPLGSNNGSVPGASYLSGGDAFAIDTKVDDGRPGTGSVISPYYSSTTQIVQHAGCGTYQDAATYNLTATGNGALVFMTGY